MVQSIFVKILHCFKSDRQNVENNQGYNENVKTEAKKIAFRLRLKNLAYPLLHGLFLFDEPGSGLSHYIDNRLINLNPNGQNIDTGLIHVSERKARIKQISLF